MTTLDTTVPRRPPTEDPWQALLAAVSGRLVTREVPDYPAARLGWVVNVDQRPAAVLEVAHVHDVVAAVRWATPTAPRSAPSPSGTPRAPPWTTPWSCATRALGGVEVGPGRRHRTVGAGVKWGELCAALDGTRMMALAGSNPDPTVVGLVGGGVSWFTGSTGPRPTASWPST